MNKFRNNLHAAFFEQGMSEKQQYYPDAEMLERERVAAELEALRAEEAELMRSVEGVNLPDIAGEVLADIPDDDTEGTAGKKDVFQHRIADKPEGSEKTYKEIWANKITLGLGALITKLEESNYFDDCADQAAKDAKIAQVKQQYFEEVKKEYKENVFDADEMTFNGVKDNLFDRAAEDSITNRMFESLTTAVVDETVEEDEAGEDEAGEDEAGEDEAGEDEAEEDEAEEDEAEEDEAEEGKEEAEAIKEEDLSEIGKGIIAKVRELYGENDLRFFNSKKERFIKRHDKPENGTETYNQKWERNISEGLTHLMSALEENHYFDGLDDDAKAAEIDRVKALYLDEVSDQYKDDIWNARDKKFDRVKDVIFTNKSEDYPANKIYTKLTGAATISKVERQNTEGYDISLLDSVSLDEGDDSSKETMSDRQNRRFLSNDLPKYLWDIRKTPGILNVMKWLPIFSVRVDRPSEVDRDAISDFIKAASRIPTKDGKDPAIVLLESLHDNKLNTDSTIDTYVDVLVSHGMDLDAFKKNGTEDVDYKQFKKCVSKVMEVGKFYIGTQSADNDIKDQHAIYLSVLKIIETSGGVEEAAQRFKDIVDQSKKDKKTEKKEGYGNGEKLQQDNESLYNLATKLGMTDFTNATRLNQLKKADDQKLAEDSATEDLYFKKTSVGRILANLNNDRTIDARDNVIGGSKAGPQFLRIFELGGGNVALNNLLERAKLENAALGLGLDNSKFTEEEIHNGNVELILLLQNIISKPGEDLMNLLYDNKEDPFESIDAELAAAKEKTPEVAREIIRNIDFAALERDGLHLPTQESMQSGLAATLYSEYSRGLGLGGRISFDQWIKGVEMNTGFQVRDDGKVVVGIGLDYHNVVNLGKGWTLTPELSAGAFIPLFDGKVDASAGLNVEVAKNRITSKGVQQKLGLNIGATQMLAGATVLSAGLVWSRDKAVGIETAEQKKKGEMEREISTILTNLDYACNKGGWDHKLDFTNEDMVYYLNSEFRALAKSLNVEDKDVDMVANAAMRLLIPYNGATLTEEHINMIAQGVAEQYAMAWAEDRKAHISEKTYLSGAGLGAFWVAGSPLVGVYASMKWTDHDLDGYGDQRSQTQAFDRRARDMEAWSENTLDHFNQRLGLSEKDSIKLIDGMVVIPSSTKHLVRVNTKMKGHMQKDALGNVKLLPQTPMSMNLKQGAATQGKEIVVGGSNEGDSFQPLDTLGAEWFTDGDIVLNDVLSLSDALCTEETLNNALEGIKARLPEGDPLKDFDFSKLSAERLTQLLDQINAIDKSKKVRIVIDDNNGVIDVKDPVEGDLTVGNSGRLELVYRSNFEMIDRAAEEVSKLVYAEAAKVVCPVLHRMCHGKSKWPEYVQFANLMNEGKYADAKPLIINILNRLDKEVDRHQKDKVDFDQVADKINAIDDPIALGQALMSVNNIFARSIKVFGNGNDGYEFKAWNNNVLKPTSMGRIIAEREMQIRGTVDRKVADPTAKQAYLSLIDASKRYREANRDMFNVTESKSAQLGNTVGFNLGNSVNPENPLFNPDIYAQTVDLKALEDLGFDATQREALHKHTMELFANNPVLINPILKALGLEGQDVTVGEFSMDGEKGKLILDIGGKKVTLSADMKFGYFTQCVNHTVLLDSIGAATEDGASVDFGPDAWREGKYKEGNKSSIVSTTEVGVTAAVTFGKEKKQEQTDSGVKTDDATDGGKQFETNPSGTDPVPTDPTPAGPGTTTVSGGDEF